MDAHPKAGTVKEFGISVPYKVSEEVYRDDVWGVMDSMVDVLKKARDAAMNEQYALTWHLAHGSTAQIDCWYCSWRYRFWKFWRDIAWWSSTCEGCDNVMYLCGQVCEFWEDYD